MDVEKVFAARLFFAEGAPADSCVEWQVWPAQAASDNDEAVHGSGLMRLWHATQCPSNLLSQREKEGAILQVRRPLIVEHEGGQLVVRLLEEAAEEQDILVLEERLSSFSAQHFEPLGLSPRETEVLFWVIQGKIDPDIATILGISTRTVRKHQERIYRQLGVETRTAAVQALEAIGLLRRES